MPSTRLLAQTPLHSEHERQVLRHPSEEIAAEMIWAAQGEAAPDDDEWDEEALGPQPLRSISAEETEAQCRGALQLDDELPPVTGGGRAKA